jgi:hypothetical protein
MMRLAGHSSFNSLADACPPKLRSLEIEPRRAPISENKAEEYYCEQENEEDNEAVKTILRMSRIDVYLRMLRYTINIMISPSVLHLTLRLSWTGMIRRGMINS